MLKRNTGCPGKKSRYTSANKRNNWGSTHADDEYQEQENTCSLFISVHHLLFLVVTIVIALEAEITRL
jgi:hypothetical protein